MFTLAGSAHNSACSGSVPKQPSDIDNIGTTVKRRGRPRKNKIGDAPSNNSNNFNGGTIIEKETRKTKKI